MKIYQITSYYPPHIGGMEMFVEKLSMHLNANHEIAVLTSNQGADSEIKSPVSMDVHYLSSIEILNTPIISGLFSQLMQAKSDDIFHLHLAQALTPEITALVSRMKKIPLVTHVHLDVGNTTAVGGVILPIYKKLFLPLIFLQSARIIVQSQDYKHFLIDTYKVNEKKIVIIPNGIEVATPKKNSERVMTEPIRLLFVGRLVNQKRPDLLIEAANILNTNGMNFLLEIVGEGQEFESVQKLISKYKLEPKVKLLGALPNHLVIKKYKASHCVIQTSERESFSTVLLEAMNYGCAVIATNISGTRNILKHESNAILVNLDCKEIANAVGQVFANKALRLKIIQGGYETVQKYSWKSVTKLIENVYSGVTAS